MLNILWICEHCRYIIWFWKASEYACDSKFFCWIWLWGFGTPHGRDSRTVELEGISRELEGNLGILVIVQGDHALIGMSSFYL